MIWAVVDDAGYENEYEIVAWGTGWEFPDELNHCRYMGTAQDGAGYVWHYFMREKFKSWSPAETGIATDKLDRDYWYWNGSSIQDCTTNIDNLQSAVEYLTAAVASSNTATLKACT